MVRSFKDLLKRTNYGLSYVFPITFPVRWFERNLYFRDSETGSLCLLRQKLYLDILEFIITSNFVFSQYSELFDRGKSSWMWVKINILIFSQFFFYSHESVRYSLHNSVIFRWPSNCSSTPHNIDDITSLIFMNYTQMLYLNIFARLLYIHKNWTQFMRIDYTQSQTR